MGRGAGSKLTDGTLGHYTKVRFAIAMACACGLVYTLSFALLSVHRPCGNNPPGSCPPTSCPRTSCPPTSCTPGAGSPSNLPSPFVSLSEHRRLHPAPEPQSDTELMALNNISSSPQPLRKRAPAATDISRIVFGIAAAADMWSKRKEYVKLWWKPTMRGFVWFDKLPEGSEKWDASFPRWKVSENTSHFEYTYKHGWRSAIRISRIVCETYRLGLPDVDWFVLGDDDTLFFPENLVKVLSKYDHTKLHYIGSNSESHLQNILFSYNMAFGGGGFAISSPLVKMLSKIQDSCLARYPHLFGSDDRMHACMAELGVPLTKEPGFHQFDIHGDASGILAAHPVAPLITIHHLDLIDPIFPHTVDTNYTRVTALQHLLEASAVEAASTMQQSICYDPTRRWSFTVSWGYVVQVYSGFITPRELEVPQKTFLSWHKETSKVEFPFNTRSNPEDVCKRPTRFFMDSVQGPAGGDGGAMESYFVRQPNEAQRAACAEKLQPLSDVQRIRVVREVTKPGWYQRPRRYCCRVQSWKNEDIDIHVGRCEDGETLINKY